MIQALEANEQRVDSHVQPREPHHGSRRQTNIAIDLLTPLVEGTRAEQLGDPTPCEAWTVADLISHFVMGGHMFAASLRGAEISGEPPADVLGDDHVAAYLVAIVDFQDAVIHLDSLEKPAQLPFGTVPADVALRIAAGDLLVHGWDLSQATGQGFQPPEDVVEEIEGFYRVAIGPELRAGGSFGEPIEVAADSAPLERLVAFAGRQP